MPLVVLASAGTEQNLNDASPSDSGPRNASLKGRRRVLKVRRLPVTFRSDIRRVITRFFDPGGEARIRNVIDRVRSLSGGQVDRLLEDVFLKFRTRHSNMAALLEENYRTATAMIALRDDFSQNRRLLIGSYLTAEYSIDHHRLWVRYDSDCSRHGGGQGFAQEGGPISRVERPRGGGCDL